MIKYKTLELVSLFPTGVAIIGGEIQRVPKYLVTTILCGLKAH